MKNPNNKRNPRRRTGWIIAGVVILIFVAAFLVLRSRRQAQAAQYQTQPAALGTLTATVGATGTVRAHQTAELTWQTTGTIGTVAVQPGDHVTAGEALASLNPTSLPESVISAQGDLASAQKALDDLLNTKSAQAQAQLDLANAQKNLTTTLTNYYNQTSFRSDPQTIMDLEAQMALAQKLVDFYQSKYNDTSSLLFDNPTRASAYDNLYNAKKHLADLTAEYNWATGHPDSQDQAVLDAQVAQAQAQVADAQRTWDQLQNGPDPNDVQTDRARVAAAQAAVQMAEVTAPFAGTVTEVNNLVGDQVAPGSSAFRIDDLSALLVDVQVSEVDINSVQVGQPVNLTFDAIQGKTYDGKVVTVALAGDVSQGAVNFTVTVQLTDPDAQVKPGMTAAVSILVKQLNNVLTVPNGAVRALNNQQVVYVIRNGIVEAVPVTLGASSDTSSQVISGGLKTGDLIVLNPPSTIFSGQRVGGGGGGGFRFRLGGGGG
jgi:HlyD family secretion protein